MVMQIDVADRYSSEPDQILQIGAADAVYACWRLIVGGC